MAFDYRKGVTGWWQLWRTFIIFLIYYYCYYRGVFFIHFCLISFLNKVECENSKMLIENFTSGVYVKTKGTRDPRCSVMVANYVSCLDSLAASHVLGTISVSFVSCKLLPVLMQRH